MAINKNPLGIASSIEASGEIILGDIVCEDMDTFTASLRATFDASSTAGARVLLYFASDSINYDTEAYASFDLTLSAGNSVQKTGLFDLPQSGSMRVSVKNLDATYPLTNVSLFSTQKRYLFGKIIDLLRKVIYGEKTK